MKNIHDISGSLEGYRTVFNKLPNYIEGRQLVKVERPQFFQKLDFFSQGWVITGIATGVIRVLGSIFCMLKAAISGNKVDRALAVNEFGRGIFEIVTSAFNGPLWFEKIVRDGEVDSMAYGQHALYHEDNSSVIVYTHLDI